MNILYLSEVLLAQQLRWAYWALVSGIPCGSLGEELMTLKALQLFSKLHSKIDQVIHGQIAGVLLKHLEFQLVMLVISSGISLTAVLSPTFQSNQEREHGSGPGGVPDQVTGHHGQEGGPGACGWPWGGAPHPPGKGSVLSSRVCSLCSLPQFDLLLFQTKMCAQEKWDFQGEEMLAPCQGKKLQLLSSYQGRMKAALVLYLYQIQV